MTQSIIAQRACIAADPVPFTIRFVLRSDGIESEDLAGVDLSQTIAVRALASRPDGSIVEWSFTLPEIDGGPLDELEVSRSTLAADFVDVAGRPMIGTYSLRFLLTLPSGEIPFVLAWLSVESLL